MYCFCVQLYIGFKSITIFNYDFSYNGMLGIYVAKFTNKECKYDQCFHMTMFEILYRYKHRSIRELFTLWYEDKNIFFSFSYFYFELIYSLGVSICVSL